MFLGHFAVAFAAKKAAPKVSLGTLFLSVNLVDLLWPVFLLLGLEHVRIDPGNTVVTPLDFTHYPITHSLLTSAGWAALAGLVFYGMTRNMRGMILVSLAVLSHWFLDALSHRPDLLLVPGGATKIGLGLWNSFAGTLVLESALFVGAVVWYAMSTESKGRTGVLSLWSLVVFLTVTYLANLLGPPPPDENSLAVVAVAAWLIVPWGYWIDRTRRWKDDDTSV